MKLGTVVLVALALMGSLMLVIGPATSSDKKPRPPKPEELVGVWIGFWEDNEFTRLELHSDSTGYCAFVASKDSIAHEYGVQVYRVTNWNVDGWNFVTTLAPAEARLEKVYLKGDVRGDALELQVGGEDRKWKEKVVLRKETQVEESNLETKNKIEEAKKQ